MHCIDEICDVYCADVPDARNEAENSQWQIFISAVDNEAATVYNILLHEAACCICSFETQFSNQ